LNLLSFVFGCFELLVKNEDLYSRSGLWLFHFFYFFYLFYLIYLFYLFFLFFPGVWSFFIRNVLFSLNRLILLGFWPCAVLGRRKFVDGGLLKQTGVADFGGLVRLLEDRVFLVIFVVNRHHFQLCSFKGAAAISVVDGSLLST